MTETVRRVLQRVVLPTDHDTDVLPLYVDPDRPQLDVDKSALTLDQRAKLPPTEPNSQTEADPADSSPSTRKRIAIPPTWISSRMLVAAEELGPERFAQLRDLLLDLNDRS